MEECNSNKKIKILIAFDDIIADILSKKINPKVPEIFIRGRKLSISFAFITQLYFTVLKNVWIY